MRFPCRKQDRFLFLLILHSLRIKKTLFHYTPTLLNLFVYCIIRGTLKGIKILCGWRKMTKPLRSTCSTSSIQGTPVIREKRHRVLLNKSMITQNFTASFSSETCEHCSISLVNKIKDYNNFSVIVCFFFLAALKAEISLLRAENCS